MMVHPDMLHMLIGYLLSITLILSVLLLGSRKLTVKVYLFALQSLSLALILVFIGLLNQSPHAFWIAAFSVMGKCIIIPRILYWVVQKVPMKKEVESFFTLPTSMMLGGGLILLAHYLTTQFFLHSERLFNEVFSVGVSLVFIGLMIMMTRKKAFTQILGLYVLDNGIFCLTLATVFEMPLILEMGILFELLLGVLVLGILVSRIQKYFETVNLDELQELRG